MRPRPLTFDKRGVRGQTERARGATNTSIKQANCSTYALRCDGYYSMGAGIATDRGRGAPYRPCVSSNACDRTRLDAPSAACGCTGNESRTRRWRRRNSLRRASSSCLGSCEPPQSDSKNGQRSKRSPPGRQRANRRDCQATMSSYPWFLLGCGTQGARASTSASSRTVHTAIAGRSLKLRKRSKLLLAVRMNSMYTTRSKRRGERCSPTPLAAECHKTRASPPKHRLEWFSGPSSQSTQQQHALDATPALLHWTLQHPREFSKAPFASDSLCQFFALANLTAHRPQVSHERSCMPLARPPWSQHSSGSRVWPVASPTRG